MCGVYVRVYSENPYVLIFEKTISQLAPLLPLLEAIVKTNRPLLVIAEDVTGTRNLPSAWCVPVHRAPSLVSCT